MPLSHEKKKRLEKNKLIIKRRKKLANADRKISNRNNNAKDNPVKSIGGSVVRAATGKSQALANIQPEDLTAAELQAAIEQTDKAIAAGKILLPADASILVRALTILKKALLDLGGVNGDLKSSDKEVLQQRLSDKLATDQKNTDVKNQDQAAVKSAVAGVQAAQETIARSREQRGESAGDPQTRNIAEIININPLNMNGESIAKGIQEIEKAIEANKRLIPQDASRLQRILSLLRKALFELGGVDPDQEIDNKEELLAKIKAENPTAIDTTDPERQQAAAKVTQALEDLKRANAVEN